jgi:hypothetical protein
MLLNQPERRQVERHGRATDLLNDWQEHRERDQPATP